MNGNKLIEKGLKRVRNGKKQDKPSKQSNACNDEFPYIVSNKLTKKNGKITDLAHNKDRITQDIISSSKAIRLKYKKLKLSEEKMQQELQKQFKPIVEPLNKLIKNKKDIIRESKSTETDAEPIDRNEEKESEVESDKESTYEDTDEQPPEFDFAEAKKLFESPQGYRKALLKAKALGVFASKYVLYHLSKDRESDLDKRYGIRSDGSRWLLGDSQITIHDDNIYLNNEVYNGTPGLFELLFMNVPDEKVFTERDLSTYKKLLERTNGHKQFYNADSQRNSNRGHKYRVIIKPMFTNTPTGSGMSVNKPRYEYWDDPNELCDRLRLLLSSNAAGHNNHQNEILSIIEELREAKYIL